MGADGQNTKKISHEKTMSSSAQQTQACMRRFENSPREGMGFT